MGFFSLYVSSSPIAAQQQSKAASQPRMCPSSCAKRPIDLEVKVSLRQFDPPKDEKEEAEKLVAPDEERVTFRKERTIDSKAEGAKKSKRNGVGRRSIVHEEAGVCR